MLPPVPQASLVSMYFQWSLSNSQQLHALQQSWWHRMWSCSLASLPGQLISLPQEVGTSPNSEPAVPGFPFPPSPPSPPFELYFSLLEEPWRSCAAVILMFGDCFPRCPSPPSSPVCDPSNPLPAFGGRTLVNWAFWNLKKGGG